MNFVTSFFKPAAKQRLMALFPQNGEKLYDKIEQFLKVVQAYPQCEFVVPAELDGALHEVLCARDVDGNGFETKKIFHETRVELGAIGKSLAELNHTTAKETSAILASEGYAISSDQYATQACVVRMVH